MRVKKLLIVLAVSVFILLSFAGCGSVPSDEDLIVNGNFNSYANGAPVLGDFTAVRWDKDSADGNKYKGETQQYADMCVAPGYPNTQYKTSKWAESFPEGWQVRTSDPLVASLAGYEYGKEMNAVTLIVDGAAKKDSSNASVGCGWIQIYQKIKVNPRTKYKVSFEYNGTMNKPSSASGKASSAAGLNVSFFEDPSYLDQNALKNTSFTVNLGGFNTFSAFVFNSGSLRSITLCISLGAEKHDIGDSRVNIRKITMAEEVSESVQAVHTLYKNNGYKDSNTAGIIITVAAFIALALLCWFVIHNINKNYVYNKRDDDGAPGKPGAGPKGKKRADLAADEGDSVEVPVTGDGAAATEIEETAAGADGKDGETPEGTGNGMKQSGGQESGSDDGFDDGFDGGAGKAKKEKADKAAREPGKFRLFLSNKIAPFIKNAWERFPFLILIAAALIIRVICIFAVRGYRPDLTAAIEGTNNVISQGTGYYSASGIKYAPGQLYIFYYIGLFSTWFNLLEGGAGMVFFLKLPALIADLGIGYLIYGFAKKFINKKAALGISALYLFNPAILFAFSIWGGTQAVYIFFLVLALRYLLEKKYLKLCLAYAGAVFFSVSALTAAPLILVFLIAALVKSLTEYLRRDKTGKKASEGLLSPKYSPIWKAPLGILIFFAALLVLSLPFTVKGIDGGKFAFFSFCQIYKELALDFTIYTQNAFNIAGLMGKNGAAYDSSPTALMVAMYLVMSAILCAVYVMKRNRANLIILTSLLYLIVAYFMAYATPLAAIPGLIILLLACAAVGDRRLYGHYLIFSVVCLLNISSVMISAQYMNNLPDYLLNTSTNSVYGGAALLPSGLMIAGSVIALLSFLYYMYIAMDITVANKRKIFMPFDKENRLYAFDTFRSIFR